MQNEDPPSGRQWHADLINHAGRETGNRPAILPPALVHAAGRTRRFRHVCAHAYDTFDPDDADPAVRAAEKLAVAAFRKAIDP